MIHLKALEVVVEVSALSFISLYAAPPNSVFRLRKKVYENKKQKQKNNNKKQKQNLKKKKIIRFNGF